MTGILGRMAAESGKMVTWDEALASNLELAPGLDNYTMDSDRPGHARRQRPLPRRHAGDDEGAVVRPTGKLVGHQSETTAEAECCPDKRKCICISRLHHLDGIDGLRRIAVRHRRSQARDHGIVISRMSSTVRHA